jgi:preprotein translocase subunit YajC
MYIVAQTPSSSGAAAGSTTAPSPAEDFLRSPIVPILLVVIMLYFFMFRSKKTEQQKREDMLKGLKKGDEVHTIGGEFGRVMETRDDRVLLKVDESSNTKIWYSRNAIHRVMGEDAAKEKVETKT